MSLRPLLLAALVLAPLPGLAGTDCVAAATMAERAWALPPGLLLAVGLAETGVRDEATAAIRPDANSIDVGGLDVRFARAPDAVDAVAMLLSHGVGSIDVGCFQINLRAHPTAFASLTEAFDAGGNAGYAARFLRRLFARTGSWPAAIAAYHSADPTLGGPYRDRVLRFWRRSGPSAFGPSPAEAPGGQATPDPHVIRIAAAGAAVPVYTPATLPPTLRASLGWRAVTQP